MARPASPSRITRSSWARTSTFPLPSKRAARSSSYSIRIVHQAVEEPQVDTAGVDSILKGVGCDERYVKIRRPTIVVGGELTLPMLDLKYNSIGKYYEAPLQTKANGGIFVIDDFVRQQMRPMDLLNRWIVPLEKKFDYLKTVTGNKIEVPFDQLLDFFFDQPRPHGTRGRSVPAADQIQDRDRRPDRTQWREIWHFVTRGRNVEYDELGIEYILERWYRPFAGRKATRMGQPGKRHPRSNDLHRKIQHGTRHFFAGPHRCGLLNLLPVRGEDKRPVTERALPNGKKSSSAACKAARWPILAPRGMPVFLEIVKICPRSEGATFGPPYLARMTSRNRSPNARNFTSPTPVI